VEVVASLSQGRTVAAQCGLFTHKSVPVMFETPCIRENAFNKKRALFTSTLDLELRKKLEKCYIWSIALYGAETWTLRAVDQKHLEIFEMWCWRRMERSVGPIM